MDKLPDEYFIQCNTVEESNEAATFVKKKEVSDINGMWKYIAKHTNDCPYNNLWDVIPDTYCHYPIILFAEWKKLINSPQIQFETNMEKKIIGYKLSKPEYEKQAASIAHNRNTPPYNEKLTIADEASGANLMINSTAEDRLRKAGVLDLWFEPVYEEEFKVGDWVIMKETVDGRTQWQEAFQIRKLTPIPGSSNDYYCYKANGNSRLLSEFRKATPAEIEATEKITIGGYDMQIKRGLTEGRIVRAAKFGCQIVCENELRTIRKIMNSEMGARIEVKGTEVTIELIDKILNRLEK